MEASCSFFLDGKRDMIPETHRNQNNLYECKEFSSSYSSLVDFTTEEDVE